MWNGFCSQKKRNIAPGFSIDMNGEPGLIRSFMGEDAGRKKPKLREAVLVSTDTLIALLALVISMIQLAGRSGKL
jgi:hypothetical protein